MAIKSKSFLTATVMVAAMSVSGCNRSKDLIVEQVGGRFRRDLTMRKRERSV